MIYGENGTGKSTICDAFDFLGKGNVGSLENKGLGKTNKFWHTVGKTPKDIAVKLETTGGGCKATLVKSEVVVDHPEKRPKVEVLRRSQILNLVGARAADRYNAISRFIDVSGVETSENTLRKLISEIERDLEVALARVQENTETIDRFWEQAGKPGKTAHGWAKGEIARDQSVLDDRKKAVEDLKTTLLKLAAYPGQHQKQLEGLRIAEQNLAHASEEADKLRTQVAGEYLEILDILQAASRHFANHPNPDVCPLCESSEKVVGLPEKVRARIESQGLANKFKAAAANVDQKKSALTNQNQKLIDLKDAAFAEVENLTKLSQSAHLPKGLSLPNLPCPVELGGWKDWLFDLPQQIEKFELIITECSDSKKFISTLNASLQTLERNRQSWTDLNRLLPHLNEALSVSEIERRTFTDSILKDIADDVGRLYEAVHPGEGLNKISLELDPAKRASLEIATEFQGKDGTPPQAYFSDSHLDTLGLCVFLALAKLENPEETILVLDDVLGSVDEPHVERLIEMIVSAK